MNSIAHLAHRTKLTREHMAGEKNPSNDPAPYGLKELRKRARAAWIARGSVERAI